MGSLLQLIARVERAEREIIKQRQMSLVKLGQAWRTIVRNTTWLRRQASPAGMVIVRILSEQVIELGWINYPSGDEGAKARFELRREYILRALERQRKRFSQAIQRVLTEG